MSRHNYSHPNKKLIGDQESRTNEFQTLLFSLLGIAVVQIY